MSPALIREVLVKEGRWQVVPVCVPLFSCAELNVQVVAPRATSPVQQCRGHASRPRF